MFHLIIFFLSELKDVKISVLKKKIYTLFSSYDALLDVSLFLTLDTNHIKTKDNIGNNSYLVRICTFSSLLWQVLVPALAMYQGQ